MALVPSLVHVQMLHAEEYLRHVIDAHGLRVRYLGMKFKLVRPGGGIYSA